MGRLVHWTLPRVLVWVWRDPPAPLPDGVTALVRAANGASCRAAGFDYAANYAAWKRAHPGRVLPWTWLGPPAPGGGSAAAAALLRAAPGEPLYVADVEEALPPAEAHAFAAAIRHANGALIGFSSYPTRAQAVGVGSVPWDALVAACDIGLPQVYYASQRAKLAQVAADHKDLTVHVAVAPDDDPNWMQTAAWGLARGGVSVWRAGLPGVTAWLAKLTDPTTDPGKGDDVSQADLEGYFGDFPVATGQKSRGETIARTLPKVETLTNDVNALAAAVRANAAKLDTAIASITASGAALAARLDELADGFAAQLADIAKVLAALTPGGSGGTVDIGQLADAVVQEMGDRLEGPEQPGQAGTGT